MGISRLASICKSRLGGVGLGDAQWRGGVLKVIGDVLDNHHWMQRSISILHGLKADEEDGGREGAGRVCPDVAGHPKREQ